MNVVGELPNLLWPPPRREVQLYEYYSAHPDTGGSPIPRLKILYVRITIMSAPNHTFVGYNNCVHKGKGQSIDLQQSQVQLDEYNLPINSVAQCAAACSKTDDCWGFEYYDTQYIGRDMAGVGFCHLVRAFEKNDKGVSNRDAILPNETPKLDAASGPRFGKGKAGIKSTNLLGLAYMDAVAPRVKTKAELGSGASCYARKPSKPLTLAALVDDVGDEITQPIDTENIGQDWRFWAAVALALVVWLGRD